MLKFDQCIFFFTDGFRTGKTNQFKQNFGYRTLFNRKKLLHSSNITELYDIVVSFIIL